MNAFLEQNVFSGSGLLLALNAALAALLVCALGLSAAWTARRRPAPLRYGLVLAALVLALSSPALSGLAYRIGAGWLDIPVSLAPVAVTPAQAPLPAAPPVQTAQPPAAEIQPAARASESAPPPPARWQWPAIAWWQAVGTLLIAAWMAGSGVGLARVAWGYVQLARFRRTLLPARSPAFIGSLRRACGLLGLGRVPELWTSPCAAVPMVVGLRHPAIVLPEGLEGELTAGQLDAVLLHETAHIVQRDVWVAQVQRLAEVLLWWCPLVHWLSRRLTDLREQICDNYVMRTQGDGFALAEVLVQLAERVGRLARPRLAVALGIVEPAGDGLEGRVARLLQKECNTMTRMNRTAMMMTALFALLLGGVMLVTQVRAADKPKDAAEAKSAATQPMDQAQARAVRVRVLSGSDRDEQPDHPYGKPESWIVEAMKRMGAPTVQASTGWIETGEKEAEVYRTMQGGRIIKGRVNDKGEVEITGMKIGLSPRTIAIQPGQKQVVKLTDYPGAGNVFIAVEAVAVAAPATAPRAEPKPAGSRESTPGEEIAWGKETNGVVANLRALKTDVQSGKPIEFEIQVKNVSQKDVYLLSGEGGKKMDASCWSFRFDQWEWSTPIPSMFRAPLKPGETASVRCVVRTTRDDLSPDQKYRHWVAPFRNVKTNAESVRLPAGNYRVYAKWRFKPEIPGDPGPVETNPIEVRINDHRESKQPALVITDADDGKTVQAVAGNRLAYRRLEAAKAAIFAPAKRPHLLVIRSLDEAIEMCLSTGVLALDANDNRVVFGGAGPKTEKRGEDVEVTVTVTGNGSVTPVGAEVAGPVRDAARKLVHALGIDFTREALIAIPPIEGMAAQVASVSLTDQLTVDVRTVPTAAKATPNWDLVVIPRKVDRRTPVEFRNQGTTIGQIDLRGVRSSRDSEDR